MSNTFVGHDAGYQNSSGKVNVYIGSKAGFGNGATYDNIGSYNVFVGDSTGFTNRASGNVFIGSKAGYSNLTQQFNTYLGSQAGYSAVADSNTFVGYQSGYTTTTGKGNTFFGTASGRGNSTGSHNTFVGNGAGPASSNVDDNVYIGCNTGQRDSGTRNTLVGTGADVMAQNLQNATAIGAGARVAVSNALVLGNNANVGIGTSAPATRLHVSSGQINQSGVRLADLTANSPATQATDQFLAVNERGDVIKARYQLRISSTNEWSDKVFAPTYSLRSLENVESYIKANNHLPGIPSAAVVVQQGVDLVEMNATLLEKIEELTLYSIQLEKELRSSKQQQQGDIDELKRLVNQLVSKK